MSTAVLTKTSETTAKTAPPVRSELGSIALIVTTLAILLGGVIYACVTSSVADMDAKRAAFENVLNISSEEMKGKSVSELSGYRKDILGASEYAPAIGNISGYDESVAYHELYEINELILQKIAH
jgi:hypothetical protein